jgi:hypothetical protein
MAIPAVPFGVLVGSLGSPWGPLGPFFPLWRADHTRQRDLRADVGADAGFTPVAVINWRAGSGPALRHIKAPKPKGAIVL